MAAMRFHKPDLRAICKHCKADLDDGDVYEKLKSIFHMIYNDDEIVHMAHCHGWTAQNRIRFSRVMQVNTERENYDICPECKGYNPLKK